ncbi:MAG: MFS transporter [Thermoproteota archaeon]|nr:MFS transporter [Thermoproteota archaeon]
MVLDWLTNDGRLIIAARIVRAFAYGFLSIVLAIYLKLIGLNDVVIGLILTATLINSVLFTLLASFYADRIGRRKMLIVYAVLMSLSGAIFVATDNYVVLIIAALIGTINVTGSETGAFLSIEQALMPQTVSDYKKRNTIFALYNMAGTFAMAAGILLSGLPPILQQQYQITQADAIKPLFLLYSLFGVTLVGIYFSLSRRVELSTLDKVKPLSQTLSPKSRKIVGKLSGLFAVDSFAGGFVIQSIVSFWFFSKFGIELTILSYIFSVAGVLTAFSFLAAAKIADKIGLVNTMVFTHIPSNVLLILVGFAPTPLLAIGFYLGRMALSQMDVPTRQSYIVAVVSEEERTPAAAITNISRNISQAISPSLTGTILQLLPLLSAPFVIGGVLKIAYDLVLYFQFRNVKPADEKAGG